jgi:membrane-bound lytic murein transglycosylase B
MLTKDEAPRIAANVLGWVQSFQKFLSRSGAISVYRTVWRRFGVDRSIIVAIWGLESSCGAEKDRWESFSNAAERPVGPALAAPASGSRRACYTVLANTVGTLLALVELALQQKRPLWPMLQAGTSR